jgi:hypothetical protein
MTSRIRLVSVLLVATTAGLVVSSALACGDSMHRVGKGMSYRTYSAPLPVNLLLLTSNESSRELANQLALSGHGVHQVYSMAELTAALQKGGYDVLIAPFSEAAMIELPSSTAFIPTVTSRDEEKQALRSYERVMVSGKHEVKHYLKAIHLAFKNNA